jgi:hypothetical protein
VPAGRYLIKVALTIKVANKATQLSEGRPPESGQTIKSRYCACCSAQERLTRTSSISCTGNSWQERSALRRAFSPLVKDPPHRNFEHAALTPSLPPVHQFSQSNQSKRTWC